MEELMLSIEIYDPSFISKLSSFISCSNRLPSEGVFSTIILIVLSLGSSNSLSPNTKNTNDVPSRFSYIAESIRP